MTLKQASLYTEMEYNDIMFQWQQEKRVAANSNASYFSPDDFKQACVGHEEESQFYE